MITTGVWLLLAASPIAAGPVPVPDFHSAEGFGANAPSGRGGKVLLIATVEDYQPGSKAQPIPGSSGAAVETEGPRIIVFRVWGVIDLRAPLEITKPFITIAGQTAPGGGVCLRRFGCKIETHDVIIRHLRFRPGDAAKKQLDALSVYKSQNVIIDHRLARSSTDECFSVTGEGCADVTVQWCLITESLNESVHAKGSHGYDSQNEVGGWPKYDSTVPPRDSDNDAMPDDWEPSHHLDPIERNAYGGDLIRITTTLKCTSTAPPRRGSQSRERFVTALRAHPHGK